MSDPRPRAIVVEDDPSALEIASRQLRTLGYDVEAFASPAVALAALRADPSQRDLLVVDLCLPWIDGATTMGLVRGVLGDLTLPTIAVSGIDQWDSVAQRVRDGGAVLVQKPARLFDLAQAIISVVDTVDTPRHVRPKKQVEDAAAMPRGGASWTPTPIWT